MKNILVTGASKGVGLKITSVLLEKGYAVYAVNRTVSDELKSLQKKFPDALKVKSFDLSLTRDIKKRFFQTSYHLIFRFPDLLTMLLLPMMI